jgi:hypothetical protein
MKISSNYDFMRIHQYLFTSGVQSLNIPLRNIILYTNNSTMETVEGYKEFREPKREILYSRMDDTMIEKLRDIRKKTGISVSEIIREAVRRLLADVEANGSIKLHVGD